MSIASVLKHLHRFNVHNQATATTTTTNTTSTMGLLPELRGHRLYRWGNFICGLSFMMYGVRLVLAPVASALANIIPYYLLTA